MPPTSAVAAVGVRPSRCHRPSATIRKGRRIEAPTDRIDALEADGPVAFTRGDPTAVDVQSGGVDLHGDVRVDAGLSPHGRTVTAQWTHSPCSRCVTGNGCYP